MRLTPRKGSGRRGIGVAVLLLLAGCASGGPADRESTEGTVLRPRDPGAVHDSPPPEQTPGAEPTGVLGLPLIPQPPTFAPPSPTLRRDPTLPGGRTRVFAGQRFLVAYYGTAGTGSLGVLGETDVDTAHRRLVRAGRPFVRRGERLQPVYELIVTVADAAPGKDGDYSHEIDRRRLAPYLRAAHRYGALLLLDLQPGRTDFLTIAKRWSWALRDPYVGLALDPEWRMGPHQVPARVVGHVRAAEVNRVSAWLAGLVRDHDLPEKLFVLHQFRTSMVTDIARVRHRPGLAMVQHVDGFGTPRQKLGTYRAVLRPRQFLPGLKLFYDEDHHRMGPAAVRAIRPAVRFVSFQ